MKFISTRGASPPVPLSVAIAQGLAPDGGLYVPEAFARHTPTGGDATLHAAARSWLTPFFEDDALAPHLDAILVEAFSFDVPLVALPTRGPAWVLELFHGPTAAFKDFGARFLAACIARIPKNEPLTVLVATSGDTGSAVAAAFHGVEGIEVVVLYPADGVSPRQEHQLTCWGDNVHAFRVDGTFDDCQRLVKQAFADPAIRARRTLTSANSINLGRLLPQAAYYAWAATQIAKTTGQQPSFIIPSGNLGNAVAALWAREAGWPLGAVILAHNANAAVPRFLDGGIYAPTTPLRTLASAMDVGCPSNLERLRALYPDGVTGRVQALSVSDDAIRETIQRDATALGTVWCPHSATAAHVYAHLPAEATADRPWVIVATAHPAKFPEVVEPLIGREIAIPKGLARTLERPTRVERLDAQLDALRAELS
jgi:threonine synthase